MEYFILFCCLLPAGIILSCLFFKKHSSIVFVYWGFVCISFTYTFLFAPYRWHRMIDYLSYLVH